MDLVSLDISEPTKSGGMLIGLSLTPSGHLVLDTEAAKATDRAYLELDSAFTAGSGAGLLRLASWDSAGGLSATALFWRSFAREFLTCACTCFEEEETKDLPPLSQAKAESLFVSAPPMHGSEYLSSTVLMVIWGDLATEFVRQREAFDGPFREFLRAQYPTWGEVGRVAFHLAENKQDPERPFAFLATYITRLSAHGKAQHVPLGRALQEYAGTQQKQALLRLLKPVQQAAEKSAFMRSLVETNELFHPLAWSPAEACSFLKDAQAFESAGILVRIPRWKTGRPPQPQVRVSIGEEKSAQVGLSALVDFSVELTLGDQSLSAEEVKSILNAGDGLVRIRGEWVQVDASQIQETLDLWQGIEKRAKTEGISFLEGMRLLSANGGASLAENSATPALGHWSRVEAGSWLAATLAKLRDPAAQAESLSPLQKTLKASLRPYQIGGVEWLWLLYTLRLGGCLADDMGLGKTIQLLALLLLIKAKEPKARPSLLVVPASLIGNWKQEAAHFAPSLKLLVAHPSEMAKEVLCALDDTALSGIDLVITTYGYLRQAAIFTKARWNTVVVDEAQAIKNPGARQSKEVKALTAEVRFALTGTPIENGTGDLWSLFDFINPGLLGSAKEFGGFVKKLQATEPPSFAPLKNLVRPYILRRLKTDRTVISDLPEKTELSAYCSLTPAQAALYARCVKTLKDRVEASSGIQRKGIILSFLMQFKQICNHPSQWSGAGDFAAEESGKFKRLGELCEEVAARQEKVLVFTQFRELTTVIADFLGTVFKMPGITLDGGTPIKQRKDLVARFNADERCPFFVLSLKAGGVGLNLTAASHVIHFDRWWNPAVEDQATDRAFRIGQKRNVLVHKFVCRGTIEERIDEMIASKKEVAEEILGGGAEKVLTEMNNDELLKFVSLDMSRALE